MAATHDPRDTLLSLASEYRHLRSEHQRASPESSTRRRLEADMHDVAGRIERRLGDLDLTDDDREAWNGHVYHGTEAPEQPTPVESVAPPPPPPPDRPSGRRAWPR